MPVTNEQIYTEIKELRKELAENNLKTAVVETNLDNHIRNHKNAVALKIAAATIIIPASIAAIVKAFI